MAPSAQDTRGVGSTINHNTSISSDDAPTDLLDGEDNDPIVICGMSIKFPQDALTPQSFWDMIVEKRCASIDFPPNRLALNGFHHGGNHPNTIPLRGGHFIAEDLALFDADFFSISPAEAAAMDPMQRWLLEVAYRALENAGIPMEKASGSATGVYTGSFGYDYMIQLYRDPESPPKYAAVGVGLSMLANRLSWFYNFRGPSIGLDTACSSAATALDIACEALKNRSCDMCLVAGCSLTFSPEAFTTMSNLDFLSPDSRCFSFDHRANGYSRGEGIAVLVLKRLSDAMRDGNMIRAVIRATAVSEDGKTPGITQPSREAQDSLIRETYKRAGLSMEYTRYFEAHGTGTLIGDPREAQAIGSAFRRFRSPNDPLYVGAVKSNIGHLEGASGLAGIVKAIMVLEKGVIPPNTNFELVNPKIDTEHLRLKFPTKCHPWPTKGLRRASINSFGYGGSNAHIVLDDAYNYLRMRSLSGEHCTNVETGIENGLSDERPIVNGVHTGSTKLLIWSASDKQGIDRLAQSYRDVQLQRSHHLDRQIVFDNLAYTLDSRRTKLVYRSFALLDSIDDLGDLPSLMTDPTSARAQPPKIAFVFTGQGAQWYAMGRQLMHYVSFIDTLKRATHYLRSIGCPWDVIDELSKSQEMSHVDQPIFSQTLTTILQTAIVDLLRSFGIQPAVVLGHSSGEIAAAYAGSHITAEFAWKLAYLRGHCAQELLESSKDGEIGAMLAVGLSEQDARKVIDTINTDAATLGLDIACINSHTSVTVSGEKGLIHQLHEKLKHRGVFSRELRVGVAYHSAQMKKIAATYINQIGEVSTAQATTTLMISTVTGARVTTETLQSPMYWADNMVSPVQFLEALSFMCAEPPENYVKKIDGSHRHKAYIDLIIEIGPHAALQGPIKEIIKASPRRQPIEYLPVLRREQSALETTLRLLGQLYCMGLDLNLRAANEPLGERPRSLLVDLPEYPFDHSRGHWYESRLSRNYRMREHPPSSLLGVRSNDWNPMEARWRHFIRPMDMPWVEQHVVNGSILYPAAGMLVMAVEASRQLALDAGKSVTGFSLQDVQFKSAMVVIADPAGLEVQTTLRTKAAQDDSLSTYEFTIYTFKDRECHVNCEGIVSVHFLNQTEDWETEKTRSQHDALINSYENTEEHFYPVENDLMYRFLHQSGLTYGSEFQKLANQSFTHNRRAKAEVWLHKSLNGKNSERQLSQEVIHPASLDAIFHLAFTALSCGAAQPMATSVPARLDSMWLSNEGLSWPGKEKVRVMQSVEGITKTGFSCSGLATTTCTHLAVNLWFSGLELRNITQTPRLGPKLPNPRQFYMTVDCNPDLSMMSSNEIHQLLQLRHKPKVLHLGTSKALEELVETTLLQLVCYPGIQSIGSRSSWKRHYLQWAYHHVNRLGLLESAPQTKNLRSLCNSKNTDLSDQHGATGRVYTLISDNILSIFRDDINPLELILQDSLFTKMYDQWFHQNCCASQISTYIHLLAHQFPGMKFLELGSGTGAGTRLFIDSLRGPNAEPGASLRCNRYDVTDVSPATFVSLKQEFSSHLEQMSFKPLDMELDFVHQGFQHNEYDAIVAASVLHVTSNLEKTLHNIRKGLKCGGKLIIQEVFETTGWTLGFVFGLLPGWWLGVDDKRKLSPNITKNEWDTLLRKTGFSGIDLSLDDLEQTTVANCGWIVSTAIDSIPRVVPQPQMSIKGTIVIEKNSAHQRQLCAELMLPFESILGQKPAISSLLEFDMKRPEAGNHLVISLLDCGSPLFQRLDDDSWASLQVMIRTAQHIFWVSSGGGQPIDPDFGVLEGLARTWRSEHYGLHLVTLGLDRRTSEARRAGIVTKVLQKVVESMDGQNYEEEYIEIDTVLHTRRLIDANSVKSQVNSRLISHRPYRALLKGLKPFMFSSSSQVLNMPHFLETDSGECLTSVESHIYIMTRAVSLHPWERDWELELQNHSDSYGRFSTGFVLESPKGSPFRAGDRVYVNGQGLLRSKLWVLPRQIAKLPSNISYVDACVTIPSMMAAYTALPHTLDVSGNYRILIEEATSLVVQAMIWLLRDWGFSDIWVIASNQKELVWVQQNLGVPSQKVLPRTWFKDNVMISSQWKGTFDILIAVDKDSLFSRVLDCLKSTGHLILLQPSDLMQRKKNTTYNSQRLVSTTFVRHHNLHEMQQLLPPGTIEKVLRLCSAWAGKGTMSTTFPASCVIDAVNSLRQEDCPNTVIVEFENMDEIEIQVPLKPACRLESEATYIIAGGLGGLGRSLARWLVTRGARNLVLLSRSGPVSTDAAILLKELRIMGVRVEAPMCDITDRAALGKVLASYSNNFPPFKGCIQATMVMKEGIFEKTTLSDFQLALGPKVMGSWNLHTELQEGLDFFILVSSMSGIAGRISLGAYNAGNTYQDALAHYRAGLGLSALSIDLGAVEDEGYLFGRQGLLSGYQRIVQIETMHTKEIYALLDAHLEELSTETRSTCYNQQIVGLRPPSHWKRTDDVPFTMAQPFWGHMHHIPASEDSHSNMIPDQATVFNTAQRLTAARTQSEVMEVICTALAQRMSSLLGTSEEKIEPERSLQGYGLDSLSAVELRNWIGKTFSVEISLFEILGDATIRSTGLAIARKRETDL